MALQARPKATIQDLADLAINALKAKQGSSVQAIAKYLNNTYAMGTTATKLPQLLHKALSTGAAAGRYEKVRASYKMSKVWLKNKQREQKQKAKLAAKKQREAEAARAKKAAKAAKAKVSTAKWH